MSAFGGKDAVPEKITGLSVFMRVSVPAFKASRHGLGTAERVFINKLLATKIHDYKPRREPNRDQKIHAFCATVLSARMI
jgi:hypothetical protein